MYIEKRSTTEMPCIKRDLRLRAAVDLVYGGEKAICIYEKRPV